QRYLYCRMMNQVMTRSACECAQAHRSEGGAPSIDADSDCFEARVLDRLVSFSPVGDVSIPAAPWVAMLPATYGEHIPSPSVTTAARYPIRAGPSSPTSVRAVLMVFLT